MHRRTTGFVIVVLALCLVACGDSRTPEQKAQAYRDAARKSRDDAKAAQAKLDAKGARKGADAAAAAVKKIEELLPPASATAILATAPASAPATPIEAALAEARVLAAEADEFAALAEEQAYLADRLASWKLRSYRTGRTLALRGACEGLALAADAAGRAPLASLPKPVQGTAELAASVNQSLTGRPPLPSGAPDWPGIATDMRSLGSSPPAVLGDYLAVGFLVSANDDLALAEVESVDPTKLPDANSRILHHILKGVTYRMHNLPRLARREFEGAVAAGSVENPMPEEYEGLLHGYLCYEYISQKEYAKADVEAARAMRAWPNNPLAVFITGERLLADGKREQAAESLEAAVKGTKYEWLAGPAAERVREIRETRGPVKPLVGDPKLLAKLMFAALVQGVTSTSTSAPTSAPASAPTPSAGGKPREWGRSAGEFVSALIGSPATRTAPTTGR
jgi:hypothetical protein